MRARIGRVRVVFSRPPESADERIHRLIEEARRVSSGRRQLEFRVVSSDREVAGRARLWGARSVGIEEFLRDVEERRQVAARSRAAAESRALGRLADPRPEPRRERPDRGESGDRRERPRDAAEEGEAGERKPELHAPGEIDAWEKLFRMGRKRAADDDKDDEDDGPP